MKTPKKAGARKNKSLGPRPPKPLFGQKLKAIQGERTNLEMAEIMGGIADSAYSRYLNGSTSPTARQLACIRAKIGVSLDWLCMDEDLRVGPVLLSGPGVEVDLPAESSSVAENVLSGVSDVAKLRETLDMAREALKEARAHTDSERKRADLAESVVADLRAELVKKSPRLSEANGA